MRRRFRGRKVFPGRGAVTSRCRDSSNAHICYTTHRVDEKTEAGECGEEKRKVRELAQTTTGELSRSGGGDSCLLPEELALLLEDLLEGEVAGDPGRNVDDQDLHLGVVDEVRKKLGRKEEVPEREGTSQQSDVLIDNQYRCTHCPTS